MRKKSLFETNRHLRDSAKYKSSLLANISSSTAIETGEAAQTIAGKLLTSKGSIFHISRLKRKQNVR